MTDTTREAFEAEANRQEMDLNRFEQGYSDCNTDYGWLFWQAATLAERARCLKWAKHTYMPMALMHYIESGEP